MASHIPFLSSGWNCMAVSLSFFLVLCLKGNKFAIATVLLITINSPLWSERPLIISDVEDEVNLVLSTKILPIAVL
jgi:hypothetical protein